MDGTPLVSRRPQSLTDEPLWKVLVRWLYPHTLIAAATLLLGVGVGWGIVESTSLNALEAVTQGYDTSALFPETLTTWAIFANNVVALGVIAMGSVSFGLTAFVGLFFNGFLVGVVLAVAALRRSLAAALALVLPHGILELPAFFVVGGITYRISWRLVSHLRGTDANPLTRREMGEAIALTAVAVVAIAIAAWIEANLTREIAQFLLGDAVTPT